MKNTILWDCHLHTSFSSDSPAPMEQMAERAIELGLSGITVTEHLDPDYPITPTGLDFSLDIDSYRKKLFQVKEEYKDKLEIRFGIEFGLQPHLSEYFETLTRELPFDFVIGSSHLIHGQDPYYPEYFLDKTESEVYTDYFKSILDNLSSIHCMDVYGHIDYVVRYGPNQNKFYSYEKYQDVLDAVLQKLISMGKGIELNTGGYHYGLGEPNPCTDVIRRYRELGGEIITVGADAHTPDKIAYAFDLAANVLEKCGFRYYTVFKDHKPEFLKL